MTRSKRSINDVELPYEPEPLEESAVSKIDKEAYRQRLAEYLKDPEFRKIEGFPIGTDEAILALSDPPYYTACPNPFLPEIIEQWQQERRELRKELGLPDDENPAPGYRPYRREPYAADVSEGKNDPIYNAHSYHTKVPHKAIMRYILHYTDPGDIVYDGFCGTGMTGVAAQLCGDKKTVESLGYKVKADGTILDENGEPFSRLGARKAVLNDLSPAATFIAYNYNTPVDARAFEREAKRILKEVEDECGWMYKTWHPHCEDPNRVEGTINYVVWSDVFICPQCGHEMVFWELAIDKNKKEIKQAWNCPNCEALVSKNPSKGSNAQKCERFWVTYYDQVLRKTVHQAKQVIVKINYSIGNSRKEKNPDSYDYGLISQIENWNYSHRIPDNALPKGYNTNQPKVSHGLTNVHHFFSIRNLFVISSYVEKCRLINQPEVNIALLWGVTAIVEGSSKLNRDRISGLPSKLAGTLYIGSTIRETNALQFLSRKLSKLLLLKKIGLKYVDSMITTQSSSQLTLTESSFNYLFVDPPFGGNIMYSELNFLWEAVLRILTNNQPEAIINKIHGKRLFEYQQLVQSCFKEFFRILKPGHWMTVEFHNSQNSVWNAIQEALLQAGFMVADVRTLDKQQGTFKQVTTSSAVKQDLVISAYKPAAEFIRKFSTDGGTATGTWDFIRQHLEQLPMPSVIGDHIEVHGERMPYLLYDRMVAFHLVRGLTVPLSSTEFYQGLSQRWLARDGMYFTAAQATNYDKMRLKVEKVQQMALFVTDEASAILWLQGELNAETGNGPQTYSEIQPRFFKQLILERYEKLPELQEILKQNFLRDAEERWFVPDLENAAHLEALREQSLLREFNEYLSGNGKIKTFRAEAVKAGFSKAWSEHRYADIIQVAERLPEQALLEDPKLKLYYDNALNRASHQPRQEKLI